MRDLLLQLAVTDMFRAKWTADIHREWIDALLLNQPYRDRAALERTRDRNEHCDAGLSRDGLSQPDSVASAFPIPTTGMFSPPPSSGVAMLS